jgi:hypothetical protein
MVSAKTISASTTVTNQHRNSINSQIFVFIINVKYRITYNISISKDISSSTPSLIFEISLLLMFGSSSLSSSSSNLTNTMTGAYVLLHSQSDWTIK